LKEAWILVSLPLRSAAYFAEAAETAALAAKAESAKQGARRTKQNPIAMGFCFVI
jgi:hypothetical protein